MCYNPIEFARLRFKLQYRVLETCKTNISKDNVVRVSYQNKTL